MTGKHHHTFESQAWTECLSEPHGIPESHHTENPEKILKFGFQCTRWKRRINGLFPLSSSRAFSSKETTPGSQIQGLLQMSLPRGPACLPRFLSLLTSSSGNTSLPRHGWDTSLPNPDSFSLWLFILIYLILLADLSLTYNPRDTH